MSIDKSNVFKPIQRSEGLTEKTLITRGLWEDGVGELLNFYTSSVQSSASKQYHIQVVSSTGSTCDNSNVFSISFGHIKGSGSLNSGGDVNDTPSRAIYSQHRLLCLDPNYTQFKLMDSSETPIDYFYSINFNREKLGDKLDPGNFQIKIGNITLIDDTGDSADNYGFGGIPSNVRALVSGTINNGIYNSNLGTASYHHYGLVYPDLGTIIIAGEKLDISGSLTGFSASMETNLGANVNGQNALKLFSAISSSATSGSGNGFIARSVDIKEQDFYFVRVYNTDFNYSNNPTYTSNSTDPGVIGKLSNTQFQYEPTSYITTIGLYNDANPPELLAVAKLSKPLQKTFSSEVSLTVKLEY
ncbi:hypothetical protein [Microcystis phage Mel-JY01]